MRERLRDSASVAEREERETAAESVPPVRDADADADHELELEEETSRVSVSRIAVTLTDAVAVAEYAGVSELDSDDCSDSEEREARCDSVTCRDADSDERVTCSEIDGETLSETDDAE